MKSKEISISPAVNLIEVLGSAGYTFETAIADLIDNSISAGAKEIIIYFNIKSKNKYLYILDDGIGMSDSKMKQACTIAYHSKCKSRARFDLGRYSTGLKSATKYLGDNMIIASKHNGKSYALNINYSEMLKNNEWVAKEINDFKLINLIDKQGTIVYCDNLTFNDDNNENIYNKLDKLKEALSHIFAKYINDHSLNLYLQVQDSIKIKIEGWDPFKLPESTLIKKIYDGKIEYKNEDISVKIYIFPPYDILSKKDQLYMFGRGLIEQSGFYVYRNNRLIQEGGWLNLDGIQSNDKTKYCRIEVDIPSSLDKEFDVNFIKTNVNIPFDLQKKFEKIAKTARTESAKTYNYLKKPKTSKIKKGKDEKVWITTKSKNGYLLKINKDHSLVKEYTCNIDDSQLNKLLDLLSRTLPIMMIKEQNIDDESFTYDELLQMMRETYQSLKKEKMTRDDIIGRMRCIELFKSLDDDLWNQFIIDTMEGE